MKFFFAFLILATGFCAQADLLTSFQNLEKSRKGVFGLNQLQGTKGRINVLAGSPAGKLQFQAAYRNDAARELAVNEDFYVGNLFTTNYYELMGEFVFGDARSSHELDHDTLFFFADTAMVKASSMVRHWVLEKHYVHQFPNSLLGRSFRIRGISGSEFEQEYAQYFLNFFLSGGTTDTQYLTAWLLAKGSPIAASNSLERARAVIAKLYDEAKEWRGASDPLTKRLYQLRNAIHNQLSHSVIGQIDGFFASYPNYSEATELREVRSILVAYYSVSAKRISAAAKKIGASEIQVLADSIVKNGGNLQDFLSLSILATDLRTRILDNTQIESAKKTDTLLVLMTISQFLNKELTAIKKVKSVDALKIAANLIYVEGFLIKDNWQYFRDELNAAADLPSAAAQLADIVGIANDTLTQAFAPSFDQWLLIEPKMQYFIDNTIKSSSLNTASVLADRIQD